MRTPALLLLVAACPCVSAHPGHATSRASLRHQSTARRPCVVMCHRSRDLYRGRRRDSSTLTLGVSSVIRTLLNFGKGLLSRPEDEVSEIAGRGAVE